MREENPERNQIQQKVNELLEEPAKFRIFHFV